MQTVVFSIVDRLLSYMHHVAAVVYLQPPQNNKSTSLMPFPYFHHSGTRSLAAAHLSALSYTDVGSLIHSLLTAVRQYAKRLHAICKIYAHIRAINSPTTHQPLLRVSAEGVGVRGGVSIIIIIIFVHTYLFVCHGSMTAGRFAWYWLR